MQHDVFTAAIAMVKLIQNYAANYTASAANGNRALNPQAKISAEKSS